MKGMIFAGCSFTWGQGLYFYSDLPNKPIPINFEYDESLLTDAHLLYKNIHRFPRLVANHFKTFEVVKKINGGQNDEALEFIDIVFDESKENFDLNKKKYKYEDISYIILQTTQIFRDVFTFEFDLRPYENQIKYNKCILERINDEIRETNTLSIYLTNDRREENPLLYRIFFDYLKQNNLTLSEFEKIFIENVKNKIKNKLNFYESKGIKTLILLWTDDILPYIENDDWFEKRLIYLENENNTFKTIEDLITDDPTLKICQDPFFSNEIKDAHPSLKCHDIISKSIINKITNE